MKRTTALPTALYRGLKEIFPDIDDVLSTHDRKQPYLLFGYLADWIARLPPAAVIIELKRQVRQVATWCESLPRGKTASDDPWTIYTVAFLERIMRSAYGPALVPHMITKTNLLQSEDYFCAWVGREHFEAIVSAYDA